MEFVKRIKCIPKRVTVVNGALHNIETVILYFLGLKSVIMDHLALSHSEPSCDLNILSHLQTAKSKSIKGTGGIQGERMGSFKFSNSLFSKGWEFKNKILDLPFNSRMVSLFFLQWLNGHTSKAEKS